MPIVILKYKLPEEQEEYKLAINGALYSIVVDEILGLIRKRLKYEEPSDDASKELEDLRTFISELLDGYNLEI